jgi:hypothetical protein
MRALFAFLNDLFKAISAPGAPWPDRSCCRFARRGR